MDEFDVSDVIHVVAAVRRNNDVYWVCKRATDGSHDGLAGMWEYPGGKVEEGESFEQAIVREMMEEFEARIEVVQQLDSIAATFDGWKGRRTNRRYLVHFFEVRFLDPPRLLVHSEAAWFTVEELQFQDHLPSGMEFNRRRLVEKQV